MFPKLKSSFGSAGKTVSTETKTFILLPILLYLHLKLYNLSWIKGTCGKPKSIGNLVHFKTNRSNFKPAKGEIGQQSVFQASKSWDTLAADSSANSTSQACKLKLSLGSWHSTFVNSQNKHVFQISICCLLCLQIRRNPLNLRKWGYNNVCFIKTDTHLLMYTVANVTDVTWYLNISQLNFLVSVSFGFGQI